MCRYLLIIIVSYFLMACGQSNIVENEADQTQITVIGEDSSNLSAIAKLAEKYRIKTGTNVKIVARSFEEAFTKSNQDFANKTGLYDIVLQYNFSLHPFVVNDYVYTIPELRDRYPNVVGGVESTELFKNAWKEVGFYRKNEKVIEVSYPFATNTMLLIYNRELFEDVSFKEQYMRLHGKPLKVPDSWEEYLNVAKFFSSFDELSGVAMQGASGGWLYYEWATILKGFDGAVMDKEFGWDSDLKTPLTLNSDEAVAATSFYEELYQTNKSSFFNVDQNQQIKLLKQGKTAMGFIWSDYIYGFFSDANGVFDERFGFSTIPGQNSPLAGGAFYINKQSKNADVAFDFVNYLMKSENQILLAEVGLCSPNKSVYEDPSVKRLPYSDALMKSLERGSYAFEAGPDSDLISNVVTETIQAKINNSDFHPETVLNEIEQKVGDERAALK